MLILLLTLVLHRKTPLVSSRAQPRDLAVGVGLHLMLFLMLMLVLHRNHPTRVIPSAAEGPCSWCWFAFGVDFDVEVGFSPQQLNPCHPERSRGTLQLVLVCIWCCF